MGWFWLYHSFLLGGGVRPIGPGGKIATLCMGQNSKNGWFSLKKDQSGCCLQSGYQAYSSSTAQCGGGSFKNRKPIGELGCCESWQSESTDGPKGAWGLLSFSLFLWLSTYLPAYLLCIYLSIYLSLSLSSLFHLITYLPIYLSTYLPMYLSTYLSIYLSLSPSLSSVYLSSCLPVCLSICLSVYLSICGAVSFSVM